MAEVRPRAGGRGNVVLGSWLIVVVACLVAAGPAYSEEGLSGGVSFDYVPRWIDGEDTGDEDVYLSLLLGYADPADGFSINLYMRGLNDVDGASGSHDSRFRSAYDTYGDDWFFQLYYAYADVKRDGVLNLARIGRQYLYRGQPFHFDGVKLRTQEWGQGFTLSGFLGVPVHFFESTSDGDLVAGLSAEMRPWRGGKLGVLYAYVEGETHLTGLPVSGEADELLILDGATALSSWGSALVRYTAVDSTSRDVAVRARASLEAIDTDVSFAYYAQLATLDEFTIDLSPYTLVQGESHPYQKIDVCAAKGFRLSNQWRVSLDGRLGARRLFDAADEGEYNRDYDMLRFGVGIEAPERKTFSADIGGVWWWSTLAEKEDVSALDAELRWRPNEHVKIGLGTSYWLYRYNMFSLAEEEDVRETFVKITWTPDGRTMLKFRWAFEEYGGDLIHKVGVGCSTKF